jgi:hypothetical protein
VRTGIVLNNQRRAILELSGPRPGLIVNLDLSGIALSLNLRGRAKNHQPVRQRAALRR